MVKKSPHPILSGSTELAEVHRNGRGIPSLGDRLTVGFLPLKQAMKVRILLPEWNEFIAMRGSCCR
jgi:hypothetical protein